MVRVVLAIIMVIAVGLFVPGGCKKSEPAGQAIEETVKSEVEFEAEAAEAITEENLDEELDRLEKEIEADTVAEE